MAHKQEEVDEWELNRFYNEKFQTKGRECVILLNYKEDNRIQDFWQVKGLKVCADGGCNILKMGREKRDQELVPDLVIGDFDSIKKETIELYEKLGSRIVKVDDQDSTDFSKALDAVIDEEKKNNEVNDCIITLNGTGGCLSHVMANINSIFTCPNRKIILVGHHNIAFVCWPGKTKINCKLESNKVVYCSLIPLFGVVKSITTSGLKWNLDSSEMKFGKDGLVSSSNQFSEDSVFVETSEPILFIVDLMHNG